MSGRMAHAIMQDKNKDGLWQSQFMDTVGDGTGTINQAVDGTDILTYPLGYAPFKLTVPEGQNYFISRLIGAIDVSGRFASGGFGLGPALTTGWQLWRCADPTNPDDFDYEWTYQHRVQQNQDFAHYAYDNTVTTWSQQYETMAWRYTITKDAAGGTFWLKGGQSMCARVYDNLASRMDDFNLRVAFVNVPDNYVYN